MTTTLKTEKVLSAYQVLSTAKYGKLDDADKIKVWKIARQMKPIAEKFEDDSKSAAEAMKPEGFDEQVRKAQEYERVTRDPQADASQLEMGAAEYAAFQRELRHLNELTYKATREMADKEVTLDFEPIGEDAFTKLMNSNDWTMAQALAVGEIIVRE